jgi:hypothetical protein
MSDATAEVGSGLQSRVYGDFADILKPESKWVIGGFPGWEFREPDAVIIVQNGVLRVSVVPLTRGHDSMQILDNAKHMYFSKERFAVPDGGGISVELDIRAQTYGTNPGDLYDGFVSLNLLDFSTGLAADFFVCDDNYSTVYARLPFPGVPAPDVPGDRYFALFKEQPLPKGPRQRHRYRIDYDQGAAELAFYVENELVNREVNVPKMESFLAALGIMTEKDIADGSSVSCHGQGVTGEWGPLTITTRPAGG